MNHSNKPTIATRFNVAAYQLLEIIGQGGFGQVYKARQLSTNQWVAIKFLTPPYDCPADKKRRYIERFERETLLGSRLQHPNIVRLLDKGVCDDELFYAVFEYVDGLTLKQKLTQSGPFSPVEAGQIMAQVLDALAHAHGQGIVHRDIKPANIMLSNNGAKAHVKILDFGISALLDQQHDRQNITLTNETLSTPSYSAPEQLRGEPLTLKTDLYIWGLVFVECLTGKPTIAGSNIASVFHQQLNQANVPLPAALIAHPVGALLRRALNKRTIDRIDSATELYHQLQQINLATLVGHIAEKNHKLPSHQPPIAHEITAEQTLMERHSIGYTRLTERKLITVLCLSLSVVTINHGDIDHEVIDALLWDQILLCQDIAIRYGACHVGTLGNTLLFYFGYPTVSDNDCRLAARAALEICNTLDQRNVLLGQSQSIATQIQMGINTGMVLAFADVIPTGTTANIAMKLASQALPNQILCSTETRDQLTTYIEFEPAGALQMGIECQEQPLYALIGERQVEAFRFLQANHHQNAFFGRQQPLSILLALNDKSLHLCGEAGIGKSRLVFEFKHQVKGFSHGVAQCLPEHGHNALYPVLNMLKYQYSIDALSPTTAASQLRYVLESFNLPELPDTIAVLFTWLALPLPTDLAVSVQPPNVQKRLLFDALSLLLCHAPNQQPKLLIVEDLHWADITTIEFIAHFINSTPFLQGKHRFVSTSRQPLPALLTPLNLPSLALSRLDNSAASQFIQYQFDHQPLAENLLQVIIERTDGMPLFIEELVNMLKQKALVHHINGLLDFVNPESVDQLPTTLINSLQQKLDSLRYAKETAQLAATIGREFDDGLLVAASALGEDQVQSDLNELVENDLIFKQRKVNGHHYIFKHALVKDAAYESIPKHTRQQIHFRLATAFENHFAERAQQQPHLLGHHFDQARQPDKASHWFMLAGNRAATIFAHNQCIVYYDKAINQLRQITAQNRQPSHTTKLIQAYKGIGISEIAKGQHPQGRQAFTQALAQIDDNPIEKSDIYCLIGKSWATHHHYEQALAAYQQAENGLTQISDDAALAAAAKSRWLTLNSARLNAYYGLNDVAAMARLIEQLSVNEHDHSGHLEKARLIHDQFQLRLRQQRLALDEHGLLLAQKACQLASHSDDPRVVVEFSLDYGLALYFNRQYEMSHNRLSEVLTKAEQLNDIALLSRCLTYLAMINRHLGLTEETRNYAQRALKTTTQAGYHNYAAAAKANLSWVELRQGRTENAWSLMTDALQTWDQPTKGTPYPMQWLGRLLQLEMGLKPQGITKQVSEQRLSEQQLLHCVHLLLDDTQQSLPTAITAPLQHMIQGNKDLNTVKQTINKVLTAARDCRLI